jgi:hypothetical protein
MPPDSLVHRFAVRLSAALLCALTLTACTPYAVQTTARPLQRGESSRTILLTVVPNGARLDSAGRESAAMPSFDLDYRRGLDERSDVGFRLNSLIGGIVTYKRRLDGPTAREGAATAVMMGAGFVNAGQHAHFEGTLIRSGSEANAIVPYGGLRVIQIAPLSTTAPSDRPTVGLFGGARLADVAGGIGVEVGVFYDRSTLGLRRNDIVVVPSISFQRGGPRGRSTK